MSLRQGEAIRLFVLRLSIFLTWVIAAEAKGLDSYYQALNNPDRDIRYAALVGTTIPERSSEAIDLVEALFYRLEGVSKFYDQSRPNPDKFETIEELMRANAAHSVLEIQELSTIGAIVSEIIGEH